MSNKLICILFISTLFSCVKSMNERSESKTELIKKMREGDIQAYSELRILYLDYKPEDFIPVAKYMSDSIQFKPANLDVFQSYLEKYNIFLDDSIKLDVMNDFDRKDALIYLKKSKYYNLKGVENYSFYYQYIE